MTSLKKNREGGFTLVELLIVMTIMPLIIGAIALGLIMVFSLQNSTSGRITDAADAQVVSSTYLRDVQSAAMVTEQPTLACGTGLNGATPTQLLGLEWGGNGGQYLDTVSYYTQANPGGNSFSLVRQLCTNGVTASAAQTRVIATDLSTVGASTLPAIHCNTVNPVSGDCSSGAYANQWINVEDIQYILLSAQEHALLPPPNSSVPFYLTLSASPRAHFESSTVSNSFPGAPFTVLGGTTCNTSLAISQNVTVSIDVGTQGKGNGTIALGGQDPYCQSVQVDNGGVLKAGSVLTTNTNLDAVVYRPCPPSPQSCVYPIPEYSTPQITDPYRNLPAPAPNPTTMIPGKCTQSGNAWTCSAGYYQTDPGTLFGNGQTVNFDPTAKGGTNTVCTPSAYQGLGACQFLFEQGLTLPPQTVSNFGTGVYVFDQNPSTGVALSGSSGITINGFLNGSSQVLFYIANGTATFNPNIAINLAGFNAMDNVTIWDADTSNPLVLGNNSNGGSITGFGGVYVPHQAIDIAPDQGGTMTVSFLVAQSLIFKNNLTVDIVHP